MNSEHRHELEANSLAGFMNNLPEHLRKHSNKIFLVVAAALLVFAGLRYRENQRVAMEQDTRTALATAWDAVAQLRTQNNPTLKGQGEAISRIRGELVDNGNRSAQLVLDGSTAPKDSARMASAWLARGELFWTLATLPPVPEATTRPELLGGHTQSKAYDLAVDAYSRVVSDFADQVQPMLTARFGLAAIAETKGNWKGAEEQYKALIESDKVGPSEKAIAQQRIVKLAELQKPLPLLPATQPVQAADTKPVMPNLPNVLLGNQPIDLLNTPTTKPTTAPTTQPK